VAGQTNKWTDTGENIISLVEVIRKY